MRHCVFLGTARKGRRKGSTPTGDKAETESTKGDVPPTPEVPEAKPEGEEGEEGGEENSEDKAPKTVSIICLNALPHHPKTTRQQSAENLVGKKRIC